MSKTTPFHYRPLRSFVGGTLRTHRMRDPYVWNKGVELPYETPLINDSLHRLERWFHS